MLIAALLLAQTAPVCTAIDAALPAPLSGWKHEGSGFVPGHAFMLTVSGGTAGADFRIETAGLYGIALDQPGWIDVLPTGASSPLKSVKHADTQPCSTVRKIVRFSLAPGTYRLALTNLKQARAKVMLVAP
jgi:hypothetical protein